MTSTHRPITSKARGICKYYTTDRGCFNAKNCKFLHSAEPAIGPSSSQPHTLTPYDQAKRCKYYDDGYCKRGDKCWFAHQPKVITKVQGEVDDDEELCSICFEKPSLYGLLGGCNHIFCIDCIRKWRDPTGKGSDISNIKKCPMCRAKCRYIIPSSRFCKDGPEKQQIVQKYKDSMARVPCKHFASTKAKNPNKPMCPFGKDCFYQHLNEDGTPYTFEHGAEISLHNWAQRNGLRHAPFGWMGPPERLEPFFFSQTEAGSIAMDMLDRLMTEVIETPGEAARRNSAVRAQFTHRANGTQGLLDSARARRDLAAAAVAISIQIREGAPRGPEREGSRSSIIVPGTMAPPNWDLDSVGDAADNGWGWNELVADAVQNADAELTERLELLADNMLGSLRVFRGRDTESPPPPLEPMDIPSPPLEPIGGRRDDDEIDDMPALQSISDSDNSELYSDDDSDEDDSDERDRYSDYEPNDLFSHLGESAMAGRHAQERHAEEFLPPLEPVPIPEPSSRLRATVERYEVRPAEAPSQAPELHVEENDATDVAPLVAHLPEDYEVSIVNSEEVLASAESVPPSEPVQEPPFVTDGRGRVVWSNKDSTEISPPEPSNEPREDGQAVPSSASRLFEWMTGLF
ncbi:hypothetical protein H0H87_005293 [Tephrocybe sp. NHM501043]|nr:hypothetical protein H0H87_005293 [Tephrocybe sp. NHM501043]